MTLKKYHQKRDFKKTPEPKGAKPTVRAKKTKSTLAFVIQKHAASHLHYDFRLELNGVLLSWAVPKGPSLDPSVKRLAMHVEDHPLEYGAFEGIIPQGQYGGGTVMLWDEGTWTPEDENPLKAYRDGNMTFMLRGKKLKGLWKLIRIKTAENSWLLMKLTDQYAKAMRDFDVTIEKPNSVKTKKSIDQIAESYQHVWGKKGLEKPKRKTNNIKKKSSKNQVKLDLKLNPSKFPTIIYPELATLVDEAPEGDHWLHEIKFDGYRLLVFKQNNKTTLMTRHHNDWTNYFKSVAHAFNELPIKNAIFDGEVVVLDEKQQSNFQLLQNSIKENKGKAFIFYSFDLIYYDKYLLINLPLIERKNILKNIIPESDAVIRYSDHIIGSGKKVFEKACAMGLEGIISKNIQSLYTEKRSKDWRKVKCTHRQEFVIGGFTKPQGSRKYFGSLLLGTYNDKHELEYNGNVGTGFTDSSLKEVAQLLEKNKTNTMPFNTRPPGASKVTWVKPNLVAEIEFSEWTQDNSLRHPSFKGLRTDKKPAIIKKEIPKHLTRTPTVNISNPDKLLYPENKISKLAVYEYYNRIKSWILPYIINRPLTLVRCPDSYKKCFYQKHINQSTPPVLYGMTITEKQTKETYIYIKDQAGLLALPQMGVLEIHPWNSSIDDIEYPDMIIFDLDPAPDVMWEKVVKAAFDLKNYLAQLKLKSFVKTTGGKGLHVVVPIKPEYDWDTIKTFAETLANFMVMQNSAEFIAKMTKAKRTGKIFIDFHRNQRGATAIAPYSTRARMDAPVATPVDWHELTSHYRDTFFTITTLPNRLEKMRHDPWKDFFKLKQSLQLQKLK